MNRETVNLIVTLLTPALLGLAAFAFNAKLDVVKSDLTAHSDANVAGLKQVITENFETQAAHAADIAKISNWTQKLQDGQNDEKQAVLHLSDVISAQTKNN